MRQFLKKAHFRALNLVVEGVKIGVKGGENETIYAILGTVSKSSDFWRSKSLDSEITKLALLSAMRSAFGV
ncbi:MAG: hypothetical protein AB9879_07590 [Methanothrix sp.]